MLIEMIIYIGLFSILIGGLIVSAFQLMDNTYATDNRSVTQEEMNFVLKKLDWALNGASDLEVISANNLKVTKNSGAYTFKLNTQGTPDKKDDVIEFCASTSCGTDDALTTINVQVDDLQFTLIPAAGSSPKGLTAEVTIDGQTAKFSKYLRK